MPRKPMSEEEKKKALERMKAGKAKRDAERKEAKEKGLPDPHPRKKRAPKAKEALADPLAHPEKNDTIPGIQSEPKDNKVADAPVAPAPTATKPIDVPNLPPGKEDTVVKKELKKKAPPAKKAAVAPEGVPKEVEDQRILTNRETGNQVIPAQYAGQMDSIKKAIKKNKTIKVSEDVDPSPPEKTVKNVKSHVPDVKAVEAKAPFSFSAVRKILYQ